MALTQIQQDGLSSNAFQAISANVLTLLPSLAGSGILIQANGQINSNVTLTLDTLSPFLTTSNVSEGSNLYYTNARVYANITAALAGNVTVGNLVVNAFTANSYTTTGNINAGNVIANSAVFGSGTGGSVTGANLISATNIQGTIWIDLYTANVIESSSKLYYTNTRVNSNVIAFLPSLAGSGIQIQANGQINANSQISTSVETLNPFLLAGM